MSNMKMIAGEMTFTPGTTQEEIKIHLAMADCKFRLGMWATMAEARSPIVKANVACERHNLKELKAQLKNFKKIV